MATAHEHTLAELSAAVTAAKSLEDNLAKICALLHEQLERAALSAGSASGRASVDMARATVRRLHAVMLGLVAAQVHATTAALTARMGPDGCRQNVIH